MNRRTFVNIWSVAVPMGTAGSVLLSACGAGDESSKASSSTAPEAQAPKAGTAPTGTQVAAPAETADPKAVAKILIPKIAALIEAIKGKDQAKIGLAKKDLQVEADKSDGAVRNSTGPAANRVNAALNNIRLSMMSNDVATLEKAKGLLEEAMN